MKGTVVGYLGKDPEKKISQNGNEYVAFSIAENHYNPETKEREPYWINAKMSGRQGDLFMKHFRKGSFAIVNGDQGMPFMGTNGSIQGTMWANGFEFPPKSMNSDTETGGTETSMEDPFN